MFFKNPNERDQKLLIKFYDAIFMATILHPNYKLLLSLAWS